MYYFVDNCSHLLLETIYQSERCYWKSGRLLNFTESQKICQSDGGILAEIPDSSTEDAVKQYKRIHFPFRAFDKNGAIRQFTIRRGRAHLTRKKCFFFHDLNWNIDQNMLSKQQFSFLIVL